MMTSTRPTPTSRGDGAFPRRARRAPAWAAIATIVALFLNLAQGILPGTSAPVAAQAGSVPTAVVPAVVVAPAAPMAVMALGGPPFIYFVPLPEDQIKASYDSIQKNGSTYRAATFITAAVNGTVIIYDQWEDGYEANLASPVQASTRIFGDGNPANGDADTYCSASCAGDSINAGDVLVLSANQTLTIPRNPGDVKFDGKDKFSANYPVAGGRAYWPTDAGPLMAEAGQFYSTDDYGTSFVMPVGENLSAYSYEAFERVAAFIMAGANQTRCTWNGAALSPINEGQSLRRPAVQTGDSLICDKPVQVHLITGDTGSNYEVRAFEAFARNTWTNSYYDPVATSNTKYPSVNYVYNPHATALTVRAETRFGTTSFSVPANGVTRYVKPDSAVHLFSSDGRDFYALNVNDADTAQPGNSPQNQTYDWGHPLIPESLLTTMMVSGWAPGSEDGTPPNGNPVWVTALGATTLYIDYDADPLTGANIDGNGNKYDATLALTRLQSARIYDTADNDQTGLRLYTLNGVKISGAWGEDGSRANVARPNIDAGTVSLPFPVPSLNKSVALAMDNNANGQYDPGDTALYRIVVRNAGGQPLVNVRVEDTLPAGVAYVAGSTTLDGAPVADDAGAFPLLAANAGLALPNPTQAPGTVPAGAQYVIEFQVTIQAAAAGTVLTNTAFLFSSAQNLQASADITVPPSTITACTLDFTDSGGTSVSFVLEGGQLYVTVADADHNLNAAVQETLGVVVRNVTGGDVESLVLRETAASSGVFRNTAGLPVSITAGVAAQDGTLNARVGQTLQADYQDALFGDTCSDTLLMAGPTQSKVLYLSEPGQSLDRIDPVAAGDTTTAASEALGIASAATIAVDNISSALNAAAVATIAVDASASAINDAAPPLAVDNTSYGTLNNASSTSFSHTTGSGSNRLMLVGVSCQQPGASITALTYNGVSLTKVGNLSNSSQTRVEIWRLIAPASGAHTVAVTNSQGDNCVIGVTTFAGVHQTTPLGTFVSAQASSATASVTASSATGELVFAAAGFNNGSTNLTPGGSQTEYWDQTVNSSIAGAGGTKAGASSVTLSWTSTSASWTIGAVPVKPAGTGGSTAGVTIPSFTTGSGSNRLMLVGVSIDLSSSSAAVSSVAYGAQSLTLVGTATNTGNERMELWRLVNPSSGTANIVVTMNGQAHNGIVAGATTFTGVDQTTPLGTFASATGTSTTPSVNVTSASGELVFAVAAAGQATTFSAVGASQTSRWNVTDSGDIAGAASTEAGAASVTMSWTSSSVPWAIGGVSLKPAGFATATASVTIPSFTTGSGSNRLMLVGVSIDLSSSSAAVSSVAYGAQSLTLVGAATNTGNERMELWRLVAPASGTANITVTLNGQAHNGIVAGVSTFTGVDQTTPVGTFALATGASTTPSVNVTSASGELVFAVAAAGQATTFSAVGAGQTSRWNATDSADIAGAASTEAGAASVTMSWTSSNVPWAIGGVPIKPASVAGGGSITAAATTSGSAASVASGGTLSFSHTPGTGANRLLLVAISVGNTGVSDEIAPGTVMGVTFGGAAMTQVAAVYSTYAVRSYIYRLVNPTASPSANVVITIGTKTSGVIASATTFTGVNQTSPLGTPQIYVGNGTDTFISGSITSATGELVYSTATVDEYIGVQQGIAAAAGQTELWNNSGFNYVSGASSTKPGAASVSLRYDFLDYEDATMAAVSIKPAVTSGGVTSTDFTQAQPMTSDFVMPAGGLITVTNYVSATGTLAANPAITATLKANGATFATLTNPIATLVSAGAPGAAYKVGSFTKSTSTGNQVITHNLGVTPKAIILWTSGNSTASPTAHYHYAQGFSDGATSYSFATAGQDNVSTSNTGRRFAARPLTIVQYDGATTLAEASFVSWDSTNLTLNWTTNTAGTGFTVHYLIIGGSGVSAKVLNWTMPTTTGNKSVTGTGFTPDLVLHMHANDGLTGAAPTSSTRGAFGFGAMNGAGQQWAMSAVAEDGANQMSTYRAQRTDRSLLTVTYSTGAFSAEASYVSMNANGFTLNFPTVFNAGQVASLAIAGINSTLSSFNSITSPGNQAITGVGFQPEAAIVASTGMTAATTPQIQGRIHFGAGDGATQASAWMEDVNGLLTSDTRSLDKTDKIISRTNASDSIYGEATLASLNTDGFTLNWTTTPATWQNLYLALDAPAGNSIYRLDWNSVLASTTTVATGQAVNLTVASGVAPTIQVLYDSSTYPSQVNLPTNTVIKVDSLGIYDAPYPGGSPVMTTSPGQTLYIRAQVSDPFGADDISGASLNISGTLVSLTAGNVVATTAAGKTYEYAWFVPLGTCQDTYPVSITANEGSEGITATAKTEILSVCSDDGGTQCAAHFLTAPGGAIVSEYGVGDTVYLRVVDFDQNLNPAVAETLTATLDSVIYTLTETGVNTGVFEAADSTIADGQLVQLVYLDPDTPLPGADVCTAEAAAGGGGGAAAPNLAVIKRLTQPASGPALVGDVIRFSLLVVNTGDEILNPVVITDTFDSSKLQYVSASLAPTGSAANSRTWNNLGPLAPNARTTIEIVFLALAPAQPTVNSATATGTPLSGPNITKSSSASVNIFGPKLGLTKTTLTPADRQAVVGANVTFQIVMSNTGDSVIDVLPLVDNFDAVCLTYVSANPAPSATGNGTLFWSDLTLTFAQNLGVGQQFTLNVTLRTLEACDPAVNSATVEFARDINGNQVPPVAGFDFVQTRVVYDFGDLPDSYGTLLTSNGARHALSLFRPLQMGAAAPDAENDGQPDATATGDDLAGTPDDEDGVTLPTFIVGQSATVVVTVTNSTGVTATLYGFIDFNGDGSFGAGEMVTRTVAHNTNGPLALPFSVPANAHTSQPVGARFRMSTAGGLTAVGLAPDGEVEDYLVQINKLARIGDFVWHDQDGDRIQDPGEPGIGGVTVVLTNSLGVTFITTTVAGVYEFPNLPAGTYTVTLDTTTVPPEYNYITTPARYVVNLTLGQTFLDADFGLQTLATVIGDYIWYDADADGVQDVGEPGIGNVTLALYRDDGDGVFEPGPGLGRDTFVGSTVSDSAGAYALRAFGAGTYFVDVTDDNGLLAGLNHTIGPQSLAEPSPPIIVQAGDIYRDADFGYVPPTAPGMAVIGDLVWVDGNRNGVREIVEPILIGVEVCAAPLAGGTGGGCDITDLAGRYLLLVPAGAYSVAPTAPPLGLTPSTAVPHVVTVASGQQYLDADFGYYGSMVALGGTIWQDLPDAGDLTDGVYSPATEPGIPNVSVNVIQDRNADGIWDTGEPIVATVSNTGGDYLFDSLLPGAYLAQVSDTLAVLRRFAVTTLGPNPGQDFNNQRQPYSVTLGAGQTNTTADFGYREYDAVGQGDPPDPGVIGDQIWYDVKEDGVYRPVDGDQAIAGVTLALRQDGAAYATITTGGYGQYLFTNLPLGHTYTVSVTDLFGVLRGFNVTTPGPNPGQNNNNQAQPYSVVLGVQRDNRTADFGYTRPVVIGDWVYFDVNGNGLADAGEPGIPAVTLDVYRGGVQLASATTNAAGMYTVTGPADTYTITVAAAELAPGGTLYGWTPTVTPTMPLTLGAGQVITTADFGFTIPSGYTVTKRLNTPDPVRPGDPISYTIRITNTGATWITALQLTDAFSETYLTYGFGGVFASLDSDDHITDGLLTWADVLSVGRGGPGMLAPGASLAVIVTFTGRSDTHAAGSAGTQNVAIIQDGRFDPDGPAGGLAARAVPSVPPASADAYVQIFTPTGLPIANFRAAAGAGGVTLTWQTNTEAQFLGFNVLHKLADGAYRVVNPELIIAAHSGANAGATYSLRDAGAPAGSQSYLLEVLWLDGRTQRVGPVKVTVTPSGLTP